MSNKETHYSFFSAFNAVGKENKKFIAVTVIGTLFNVKKINTSSDFRLMTGKMAINNRTKTINSLLGTDFEGETVWATVKFWRNCFDRFEKYYDKRTAGTTDAVKMKVVVCGSLSLDTWEDNNGEVRKNLVINVMDWTADWGAYPNKNEVQADNTNKAKKTTSHPADSAKPKPEFDDDGYVELDGFINADDLPF